MRIRDILRDKGGEVATIGAGRTVHEAVHELNSHRIGALVVTGEGGSVQGIVSERDVLRMAAETWDDGGDRASRLRDRPVVGIMTSEVICAVPDDELDAVLSRLLAREIDPFSAVEKMLNFRCRGLLDGREK